MTIAAEMKGVMPRAMLEKVSKEPPVNAEKRLNASFPFWFIHCLNTDASIPGTGIVDIILTTAITKSISIILCLNFLSDESALKIELIKLLSYYKINLY